MTREEVIDLLKKDKSQRGKCFVSDALDIAINILEQEPFINKACVSTNACKHDKEVALDKIRAEIEKLPIAFTSSMEMRKDCLEIIDKYKKESEEKE